MRQPSHADLAAQLHTETQRFTERLTREEERLSAIQDKLDQLIEAVSLIPEIQSDLAAVKEDAAKTKEIVEAWAAVKNVGRFMKWVAGIFTAIGIILTGIVITIKLAAAYLVR